MHASCSLYLIKKFQDLEKVRLYCPCDVVVRLVDSPKNVMIYRMLEPQIKCIKFSVEEDLQGRD